MTKQKKLPKIEVHTLPNGYSLDYEGQTGNGHLYFSPEKLLEGFMLHIGMKMTEQLNVETMQDFIVAAVNNKDIKKATNEINKLTMSVKTMKSRRAAMGKILIRERDRYNDLIEDIKIWRGELKNKSDKDVRDRIDKILHRRLKLPQLTFKSLGIDINDILEDETLNIE